MTAPVVYTPTSRKRTGFRPRYDGDFPTLGWSVLEWTHAYLRSPRDEREPFTYTDDQAEAVLRAYALDPHTGRRLYRRVHEEQAKGWGKSPFAASIALAEFAGPVCFDGWNADGQPVGIGWGSYGRAAPWVQIAAVSEDQTANTYLALYGLLTANHGKVAEDLSIDDGRTRLYRTDMPSAFLERVTASAGSREGQPVTFAVLDEPQLWTESNRGVELADVITRNVAKSNGWALFTGNAPILGLGSVAEVYRDDAPGVLHMRHLPSQEPDVDWSDEQMLAALREVYRTAWWIDLDRLLADIRDPATRWQDAKRFFFNWPGKAHGLGEAYLDADRWDALADTRIRPLKNEPTYASVRLARDYRSAAVAHAQRRGDGVVLRCRTFETPDLLDADLLDLGEVEAYIESLSRAYRARVVSEVVYHPGGRVHRIPKPGPEVTYHGSFFQRSRQLLEKKGLVLLEQPDSAARLAPAAAQLRGLAAEGKLHHDGDADLARHMSYVRVKELQSGPVPQQPEDPEQRIEAALASMHAVHRAMTAPRPPSRRMRM